MPVSLNDISTYSGVCTEPESNPEPISYSGSSPCRTVTTKVLVAQKTPQCKASRRGGEHCVVHGHIGPHLQQ